MTAEIAAAQARIAEAENALADANEALRKLVIDAIDVDIGDHVDNWRGQTHVVDDVEFSAARQPSIDVQLFGRRILKSGQPGKARHYITYRTLDLEPVL